MLKFSPIFFLIRKGKFLVIIIQNMTKHDKPYDSMIEIRKFKKALKGL